MSLVDDANGDYIRQQQQRKMIMMNIGLSRYGEENIRISKTRIEKGYTKKRNETDSFLKRMKEQKTEDTTADNIEK